MYSVVVERIKQEKSWDTSIGRVYKEGKLILEIPRNYPSFPYMISDKWLVCGEKYTWWTVYNLETLEKWEHKEGDHSCPCEFVINPNNSNELLVHVAYWGGPEVEARIVDFSDPTALPYNKIASFWGYGETDFYWKRGSLIRKDSKEYRMSDLTDYYELENEESDRAENEGDILNVILEVEVYPTSKWKNDESLFQKFKVCKD